MIQQEFGLWYLATPYSVRYPDGRRNREAEAANFQLAAHRAAVLLKTGIVVFSPITHSHPIDRSFPEFLVEETELEWYKIDNAIISRTDFDGIILAPGWCWSKGCKDENTLFSKRGLLCLGYEEILRLATENPDKLKAMVRTIRAGVESKKDE